MKKVLSACITVLIAFRVGVLSDSSSRPSSGACQNPDHRSDGCHYRPRIECWNDDDCSANQQCCQINSCLIVCVDKPATTTTASTTTRPTTIPTTNTAPHWPGRPSSGACQNPDPHSDRCHSRQRRECWNDDDCSANQQCCQINWCLIVCVDKPAITTTGTTTTISTTTTPPPKPGVCPTYCMPAFCIRFINSAGVQCMDDQQCPDTLKCCPIDSCNQLACVQLDSINSNEGAITSTTPFI